MEASRVNLKAGLEQLPQVHCDVQHFFLPGVYIRQMTIPAGTAIVGAVHKQESIVIVSKGSLLIDTENGPTRIQAGEPGHTRKCLPGTENIGYALTDCIWSNVFRTDETDVEKLVSELTTSTSQQLLGGTQNRQLLINTFGKDALCLLAQSHQP